MVSPRQEAPAAVPVALEITAPRRRIPNAFWRFARRKPLGAISAVFLVAFLLVAVFADAVVPYDPIAPGTVPLEGPSLAHPFGTDQLGRDMLSRIILGARPSLLTALLVVSLTIVVGTVIGLVSGYAGGTADIVIQRFVDAFMSFPAFVLLLAVVAVFGNPVVFYVSLTISAGLVLAFAPSLSRIVRGNTLELAQIPYIEASRAIGCSHARIVFRHILPNLVAPIIVIASIMLGAVILAESSLSFLGYGTPPPTPTWGGMLSSGATRFMKVAPWLAIFPGLALTLAVLAFNLFGDALRDELDPRMRK